jgi:hypothetical protein
MDEGVLVKPNEHGQSMVELAVFITFLLIILAGTIDLGRGFFTWLALRDAAQEAASYGTIRPDDIGGIQSRVWDNLEQIDTDPPAHISVIRTINGPHCQGYTIQIDVDYPGFKITMPLLSTLLGSSTIPIHATVKDSILTPACQ